MNRWDRRTLVITSNPFQWFILSFINQSHTISETRSLNCISLAKCSHELAKGIQPHFFPNKWWQVNFQTKIPLIYFQSNKPQLNKIVLLLEADCRRHACKIASQMDVWIFLTTKCPRSTSSTIKFSILFTGNFLVEIFFLGALLYIPWILVNR